MWSPLPLQAVNVAGAGPFSEVVACMTPASVPAVVTCLQGLSEDEVESPHYSPSTCLAISWEEPCDHGSEILGYSIDFGDKQPITVGKVLNYFIDGLQPDTTYRYALHSYLTALQVFNINAGNLKSHCFLCQQAIKSRSFYCRGSSVQRPGWIGL